MGSKHELLRSPGMCSPASLSPINLSIAHVCRSSPRGTAAKGALSVSVSKGIKSALSGRRPALELVLPGIDTTMHLLGLLVEVLHQNLNSVELDDHGLDRGVVEGHVSLSHTLSEFLLLEFLLVDLPSTETLE